VIEPPAATQRSNAACTGRGNSAQSAGVKIAPEKPE
jgi:hypothetical protein